MKTKIKTHKLGLLLLGCIALLTTRCQLLEDLDEEWGVDAIYNHGFTTDVFTPENALLLQETEFKLQMTPNQGEVIDLQYTMEYRMIKGDGYFKTTTGDTLVEKAKPFNLKTDSLYREREFLFVPTTEDSVKVAMKVYDTYGSEQEFEVKYFVENPPFTVSVTPQTTTPFQETTIPITIEIVQQEESEMQYEVKLNTLSDLGTITTQDGTTLIADKWNPIALGKSTWQFEALEAGDYELSLTTKDEFKQEVTKRVKLTIKNVAFDATLTAEKTELFETEQTNLTLDISQENPATITYKAVLNSVSPLAALTLPNGNTMQPDVPYDMVLGKNTLQLQALKPGTYTVDITVIDSNGKKTPKTLDITIKGVTFALTATAEKSTFYETDTTPMTLSLSQDPNNIPLAYEVRLNTISNVGAITFSNGTTMNPNEWYDITTGDTPLTFTSTTHGTYNADFTVRVKGQNERTDTASRTITVRRTEFELTPDPYVTQIDAMNNDGIFQIEESLITRFLPKLIGIRTDLTYTLSFTSTISGFIRTCSGCPNISPNTEVSLNTSNFVNEQPFYFHYLSQNHGNHTITFTVTASNGFSKSVTVNVYVYKIPEIKTVTSGIYYNGTTRRDYFIKVISELDPSLPPNSIRSIEVSYTDGNGHTRSFTATQDVPRLHTDNAMRLFYRTEAPGNYDPLAIDNKPINIRIIDDEGKTSNWVTRTFTYLLTD